MVMHRKIYNSCDKTHKETKMPGYGKLNTSPIIPMARNHIPLGCNRKEANTV